MTEDEIKEKLKNNGLENYIPVFQENHLLDRDVLSSMTDEDYISIGITIIGDRKKLRLLFRETDATSDLSSINTKSEENTEKKEEIKTSKEEYINTVKDGKAYCYIESEPDKLLCRRCHAIVSEESTLCWNCNNNLVEEKSSATSSRSNGSSILNPYASYDEQEKSAYIPPAKQKKSRKPIVFAIIAVIAGILTYTCIAGKTSNGTSRSTKSSSADLGRYVSLSLSGTQLQITTTKTLHDVRMRMNNREYSYVVNQLSPGTYTVGLGAFSDSKGNRFNPYSKVVKDIAIYSDEGLAHFAPK